jgi:hypothetical protein
MSAPRYRRTDRRCHGWLLVAGILFGLALWGVVRLWG